MLRWIVQKRHPSWNLGSKVKVTRDKKKTKNCWVILIDNAW